MHPVLQAPLEQTLPEPHSALLVQGLQTLFLQIGVEPVQLALTRHWTQDPVAQKGVDPPHLLLLLHPLTQLPRVELQKEPIEQLLSEVHPGIHWLLEQTGLGLEQSVLERHGTQVLEVRLHLGVEPEHPESELHPFKQAPAEQYWPELH